MNSTILKPSPRLFFFHSSVLLLLFPFLSITAVAQRNDIFTDLSPSHGCDCCDVSMTSRCCLDCLQTVVGRETEVDEESSPLASSRFSPEGATGRNYMAGREGEEERSVLGEDSNPELEESRLGACQCCSKTVSSSRYPRLRKLALTCCSLCRNLRDNTLTPPRDVSGDVSKRMTSPVKRMTSLDCMCCMNSGIYDCCSKCRIF